MTVCISLSSQTDLPTAFCMKPLSKGFHGPGGFVHQLKPLLKRAVKELEQRNILLYAFRARIINNVNIIILSLCHRGRLAKSC